MKKEDQLSGYLPPSLSALSQLQTAVPSIAKDSIMMSEIENVIASIPTTHNLYRSDARNISFLQPGSVHLVITSPPYWNLKEYRNIEGQLGFINDYEIFLSELDKIWQLCYEALVPGGRLICVVGDVCISRKKNYGEHTVIPLHSSIQEHCRGIGYKNLSPIIWYKITNAKYEVNNGSSFLGKPYEPNGIIKNDIEYILMERKPGGYRRPTKASRILSIISEENHRTWFRQIWTGIGGASTKQHPAPFPVQLVERLVRMFSFVGDTILDPFMGTGTTNIAAAKWGRNSIGIEIDKTYFEIAYTRINKETMKLFNNTNITTNTTKS